MKSYLQLLAITTLGLCVGINIQAQKKDTIPSKPVVVSKADSAKPKPPATTPSIIKPYKEVITDKAVTDDGLIKVHKVDDRYFFELYKKNYGKDILVVVRLSKAGADMRTSTSMSGYAGDPISENVIRFEKGPRNKVFIQDISFSEYSKDSTKPMYKAVMRNNMQSIIQAFDVKAFTPDSSGVVIDVTDFISGDNESVSFASGVKQSFMVGGMVPDRSFVNYIKSFPTNVEINTTKTFGKSPTMSAGGGGMPAGPASGNFTVEINSSFVLLPDNKMQSRYYDPRVGYFAIGYIDYDKKPQGVDRVAMIKRWRLEPKPQDLEKYKRGELVEPAKPIVFYIDPATPKQWVPYLIQGVNDWQNAFEKAGFKKAVYARMAPTPAEDPEWSLDDARYSAIVYKPSSVPNASGPSISDPRTGEIMESHINWYHNVMQLIHDWYFIQASPNDPGARKMEYDTGLMGELIRFVSAHEVGHTLGLRHNYGSSSTVPVEKLRDKEWLRKNGHTPSIMDYARFNYVAQPEDNLSRNELMPRIGDYDEWAIEWGYKRFYEFNSPDAEKAYLNKWVIEKLKNNRLWFGTETNPDDPRSQSEQVGDNAMIASAYGIKNLKRVNENLLKWTTEPNEGYEGTAKMYSELKTQYSRYLGHVVKYIGGVEETPKMQEQAGPVYKVVSAGEQKQAMQFLKTHVFETPYWLINKEVIDKTNESPVSTINNIQAGILARLLSGTTIDKLLKAEVMEGNNVYKATDLMADLKSAVWGELYNGNNIDIYRRGLQKAYIGAIIKQLNPGGDAAPGSIMMRIGAPRLSENSDAISIMRGNLIDLRKDIQAAITGGKDDLTRYHLQDLVLRIDEELDSKK